MQEKREHILRKWIVSVIKYNGSNKRMRHLQEMDKEHYYDECYEYVNISWMQGIFDRFYGKGAVNINKFNGYYKNSKYLIYVVGGVGSDAIDFYYSTPEIVSIDGKTDNTFIETENAT